MLQVKYMLFKFFILNFCLLIFSCLFVEKTNYNSENFNNSGRGDYRVMFYNTENLFDVYNDSLKNDDEFCELIFS